MLLILPIAVLVTIRMGGWWTFRVPDRQIHTSFAKSPIQFTIDTVRWGDYNIVYAHSILGKRKNEALIFIHGSPGSLDSGLPYLRDTSILSRMDVIAYDRPGFGNSGFGKSVASLAAQANCLNHLMDSLGYQKYWLMGFSYGAPVAVQTVIRYPSKVEGLCLIAGSLSPDLEKSSVTLRKIGDLPLVREIFPKAIKVSNEELIPLRNELRMILDNWNEIEVPVLIIHGSRDILVKYQNARFAKEQLVNSPLVIVDTLQGGDHFIIWTKTERIIRNILQWWKAIEEK